MMRINITIACISFLFLGQSHAQDTTSIPSESVQVIKNYEAAISQARKKEIPITRNEETFSNIQYNYKLDNITSVDFERPEPKINVLGFRDKIKRKEDIKDGTLYAAYGNFSTIKAGGAYHYYIEDWLDLGFKVDHHSAKNKNLDFNKSSQTNANVYASYFLSKKNKIGIDLFGSRQRHFTSREFLTDVVALDSTLWTHPADKLGAALNFAHTSFENTGLSFRLRLSYDRLRSNQLELVNFDENLLRTDINIIKKINDEANFEIPFTYNLYKLNSESNPSYSDFSLKPALNYKGLNFKLKAGLEYTKADSSNFIFPIIDATYPAAFAGIDLRFFTHSEFNRNSLHFTSEEFPYFFLNDIEMTPNYLRSYNLNLTKPIDDKLAVGLTFGYNSYTNELLVSRFGNNFSDFQTFTIDRKELSITPSISYNTENVNTSLNINYNVFFNEDSINIITYRPKLLIELASSQKLIDGKLRLTQKLKYSGKRSIRTDVVEELDGFIDIALGFDYRLSKSFSIFFDVTNLLGAEYEYWYRNPVYKQQLWGGIKLRI